MHRNEAITEFLLDGRSRGWSSRSAATYAWHLEWFRRWCAVEGVSDVVDLSRSLVRQWSAGLRDDWAPATCKGATTAVRSFLVWCQIEELIGANLASAVRSPKVPKVIQRTVTLAELERLIAACEKPVERGLSDDDALAASLRNAALVALLFDSLIRASEVCALRVGDVDLVAGRLTVRAGKGGNDRIALFSGETARLLGIWLNARRADCDALFVSIGGNTPGQPLTPRGLRITFRNLGERAGVPDVSPHAFRRGGAVALTADGAPGGL